MTGAPRKEGRKVSGICSAPFSELVTPDIELESETDIGKPPLGASNGQKEVSARPLGASQSRGSEDCVVAWRQNERFVSLKDLPRLWRSRSVSLRAWGISSDFAQMWEAAATELETLMLEARDHALTLAEASRLSGYSTAHLGRLVREGRLENLGNRNAPRIRTSDLPKKPNGLRSRCESVNISRKQVARLIVNSSTEVNDGQSK